MDWQKKTRPLLLEADNLQNDRRYLTHILTSAVAIIMEHLPNENDFDILGMEIAKYRKSTSFRIQRANFVSFFGIEPYMVAIIWRLLLEHSPVIQALENPEPKHLL